jgi:hypothetical protein
MWIYPYQFMLGKLDYGNEVLMSENIFLNGALFSIKKDVFFQLNGFNPDLIAGHLIGDGDTGLVNKLHENNCLIGYTPFAIMRHLQFVNKHGTLTDLGRRFYNVGISNSYSLYRKNGYKINIEILKFIVFKLLLLINKQVEVNFHRDDFKKYFSLMQRKGELTFFINLFNKEIRNELKVGI